MSRKKKHEDHINHEAWAIPFGDLMTLLLAFFVVMYAISSVNEGKYRAASASMHAAFRGLPRTVAPIQVGTNPNTVTSPDINMGQQIDRESTIEMPKSAAMIEDMSNDGGSGLGVYEQENELELVEEELREVLSTLILDDVIQMTVSDDWIEVRIKSDLLFSSGDDRLTPSARVSMQKLIGVLAKFSNRLRVEGHTDNIPIQTPRFGSNWALSSARALSVVNMMNQRGIHDSRLRLVAYADTKPVASNRSIEGRSKNRRVTVTILALSSS